MPGKEADSQFLPWIQYAQQRAKQNADTEGSNTVTDGARYIKKGRHFLCERIELRFDFIQQQRKYYPVTVLCAVMRVSRSGFYRYLRHLDKPPCDDAQKELFDTVKELFESSQGSYGSRRMSRALKFMGYRFGRFRARSLMRQLGLYVKVRRRFKVTTNSKHDYPVAPNVLARQFDVPEADKVWVVDITYL